MLTEHDVQKFDPKIYTGIALNDLVTYAVYFLSQSGKEIIEEDIVASCFLMFPKRFELRGYPQWPDSNVVAKRWIDCRGKGYITGSTKDGFSLTPKGLKLAEKVGKILGGQRSPVSRLGEGKVRTEKRTRAGRFVRALEESTAYKLFEQDGENAVISEFDFRGMLLCTMESSPSTLRNNLEQFKQHVALYNRNDLLNFLELCEKNFANLLTEASQNAEQYRGGMLRKKIK